MLEVHYSTFEEPFVEFFDANVTETTNTNITYVVVIYSYYVC